MSKHLSPHDLVTLAAEKEHLNTQLAAVAQARGVRIRQGGSDARYIDETYRVSVNIADWEPNQGLTFRLDVFFAGGVNPFAIDVQQFLGGRFVCRLLEREGTQPYVGPRPDVDAGMYDEAGFLALVDRCLTFYRALLDVSPVDPGALYTLCRGILDGRGIKLKPAWSSLLLSPARRVSPGFNARFLLPLEEHGFGFRQCLTFRIMRDGRLEDRLIGKRDCLAVNLYPRRNLTGGSERYLLGYDSSRHTYTGPGPALPAACRDLEGVGRLMKELIDFYDSLPIPDGDLLAGIK